MARVGIFGWGIVAPKSPNIESFAANLAGGESWLQPFQGFGPDNFLVGMPEFDFADYQPWLVENFSPNRYRQLDEKMDPSSKYAIGAFIQSLQQNPGLAGELENLGAGAHVYVGTGLGSLPTIMNESIRLYHSQRRWDRFWSHPERNAALAAWLEKPETERASDPEVPRDPATVDIESRDETESAWWSFWAARSTHLQQFLAEVRAIEDTNVEGDVETAKLRVIREKRRQHAKLIEKWGTPEPPWGTVSANVIWNIPNTPCSQISMLGKITGPTFSPVAACSTFGVCLKLAMDALERGEAKAVVIGATDPPPHPLVVGAFYNARVLAADGQVSKPLTKLRGTHVSGGSIVWIVADYDYMTSRGFKALGMQPLAVGVTSDADHIITPSKEGPTSAVHRALSSAEIGAEQVHSWDLHATATPGDFMEMETLKSLLNDSILVTARKGTFGHGMSAGGGWELTAQYLGYQRGRLFPTPLRQTELNQEIGKMHARFVFDHDDVAEGIAGKLSMGVGGINACILSKPWDD